MFTGIIEQLGTVKNIIREGGNLHLTIDAAMTPELKIDQSVAHNGVCLTVVSIDGNEYTVTAIQETLEKTNLDNLNTGDVINLDIGKDDTKLEIKITSTKKQEES